jgi:hypothetical protein
MATGFIQFFGGLAVITREFWLKTHSFAPPALAGFAFVETDVNFFYLLFAILMAG